MSYLLAHQQFDVGNTSLVQLLTTHLMAVCSSFQRIVFFLVFFYASLILLAIAFQVGEGILIEQKFYEMGNLQNPHAQTYLYNYSSSTLLFVYAIITLTIEGG